MMTLEQREAALEQMEQVKADFYRYAIAIGNHPFIEFCGLMNEYIKAARRAHEQGIDFSECNTHTGIDLPLMNYEVDYINEKLECIFTGRSVMQHKTNDERQIQPGAA